ncbi:MULTISPECIES: DUF6777 domain-containing protein [Streptomyces]|uniref:DUF6777 domain-containing protein n=1 Tax=Streptomyces fimbriatus TaxID=68197 RepID=A0ABW0DGN1_STRFI
MSVEPPSAGRPTGPPSGPLSGGSRPPPSGPPSQPPGGGGDAGPPGPERRPWWKSVPTLAVLAAAVAAAVLLAVVFTRSDGGAEAGGGEIFLQAANATGPDPFTGSTAEDGSPPPVTPSPAAESGPANALRGVQGGRPGLYGGTRDVSSCDVERQIEFLREVPDKNEAFASVAGVRPSEVPSHLRSLTPLQLRMDTRVTNHGYRDGAATSYQAVLQAGTAVLVDDRGVPRVRCACGNPLTEPVEQAAPRHRGEPWPGFSPSNVVVVEPAPRPVEEFVVHDPDTGGWFERQPGDTGGKDRTVPPPDEPTPSADVTVPSPRASDSRPPAPPATPPAPPPPDTGQPSPQPPGDEPTAEEPTSGEPPAPDSPAPGSPAPGSPVPPPPGSGAPPPSGPEPGPTS